jgi:hypothetical protein
MCAECVARIPRTTRLSLAGVIFLLVGCNQTVIRSQSLPLCSGDDCPRFGGAGTVYSLPKGQIQLTASRRPVQPSDLLQAQAILAQAIAAVAKDAKAVADAKKARTDDAAKDQVTIAADDAAIAAAVAQQAVDAAAQTTAQQTVDQLSSNNAKCIESASLALLSPAPDPNARFVAIVDHQPNRDDTVKLSVSSGLLTTASVNSTEQSLAIAQTVADTAIAIATLAGGIPVPGSLSLLSNPTGPAPMVAGRPAPPDCKAFNVQTIFDPFDDDETSAAITAMSPSSVDLGINGKIVRVAPAAPISTASSPESGILSGRGSNPILFSGLAYRAQTRIVVSLIPRQNPDFELVTLPSAQALPAIVPDSRTAFVSTADVDFGTTTTLSWNFSNGMLTDSNEQRPSELLAAANLPLNIIQDLFKIPTQLLQLRVNYDTQATAAINGATNVRQAQINQLTSIISAQTSLMQARINQPTAVAQAQTNLITALQALAKATASQGSTTPSAQ